MSSMHVPHAAASAALVRHRLAADLGGTFPADVLDAAALVVSELVGNAVRHGHALPGGGLTASWELLNDSLRLEVLDGGCDPVLAPAPAGPDAEGGRGLQLVAALATSWGSSSRSSGTSVWAQLPLHG